MCQRKSINNLWRRWAAKNNFRIWDLFSNRYLNNLFYFLLNYYSNFEPFLILKIIKIKLFEKIFPSLRKSNNQLIIPDYKRRGLPVLGQLNDDPSENSDMSSPIASRALSVRALLIKLQLQPTFIQAFNFFRWVRTSYSI